MPGVFSVHQENERGSGSARLALSLLIALKLSDGVLSEVVWVGDAGRGLVAAFSS